MESNIGDKDIEFALHLLNHPDSMDEEKSRAWLSVAGNRSLLQKMRVMREAGLWEADSGPVDVNAEWMNFDRRLIVRKLMRIRVWSSVAAVLLVGLATWGIFGLQQKKESDTVLARVEYQLNNGVVLITEQDAVSVALRNSQDMGEIPGTKIFSHDSIQGLRYAAENREAEGAKFHTLRVPRAADYMIILEDSTCVWLNAESELHYPVHFGGDERVVELKGEAYFKVHRDPSRPFMVKTDLAVTRVLGTEFNFQAYVDQPFNVTLVSGSVGVSTVSDGEIVLQPGQNVTNTGEGLKVEEVDVLKYTAWKDGYFYYDNTPLEEILNELGRWYDFEVMWRDESLKDLNFKFWAGRYESFERMLTRLNATGRIALKVDDRQVVVGLPE